MEGGYALADKEYSLLCNLAWEGRTELLKVFLSNALSKKKVGYLTFTPSPTNVKTRCTPLYYASTGGAVGTVKFLLKKYGKYLEINPGIHNFRENPLFQKEERHSLPLFGACLNGHLDVVKVLISAKAAVDLPNCTMSSPLHAAACNEHLAVMEYLISKHADIDAKDIFNCTPVMTAVKRGHLKAVHYLLLKQADTSIVNMEGYTLVHLAALHGRLSVLKLLLEYGLSPLHKDSSSSMDRHYIPCPLFLAAAKGHSEVVCLLVDGNDIPPHVMSDMYMLLGLGILEKLRWGLEVQLPQNNNYIKRKPERHLDMIEYCWISGVELRAKHSLDVHLPTVNLYGNMSEMNTAEEVRHTCATTTTSIHQILLIMERCLGARHHLIIDYCTNSDNSCMEKSLYKGTQRVLHNTLMQWNKEMTQLFYRHPVYIHSTLDNFLKRWLFGTSFYTMKNPALSDYPSYMELALCMLDVLVKVNNRHTCERQGIEGIVSAIIFFFSYWLQSTYQESLYQHLCTTAMYTGTTECENLGKRLVTNHLNSLEGTTLLHMALTDDSLLMASQKKCNYWRNALGCDDPQIDLGLLLYALLRWGADASIDMLDLNGQRPLHLAVTLTEHNISNRAMKQNVIVPLLHYGAHLDYFNKEGKMAMDLCVTEDTIRLLKPSQPFPLTCLACIKVLCIGMDYESIPGIPQRVKKIIRKHQGVE